ncbi:MAG TPA: hypothetical protein VEH81_09875, partial [Ktedonobacteraceae bacterium]|nr:hypothetical protein [Ktedonobacteraceae bacterium]
LRLLEDKVHMHCITARVCSSRVTGSKEKGSVSIARDSGQQSLPSRVVANLPVREEQFFS